MMGGSVCRGYDDLGYLPDHGPSAEYNIVMDTEAAQKVLTSGKPLFDVPLDSSQHKFDEVKRKIVFAHGSALTDIFTVLYQQWYATTGNITPTMFDAVAAAYVVDPSLCAMTPLRIEVTARGLTKEVSGRPNANVCLSSSQDAFFGAYIPRKLKNEPFTTATMP